jgi:hypothetical protein
VVPTRPSTRAPITACIGRAFQNQKPLPCKQTYLSVATTWLRRIDSAWTSSPLADATGRLRLLGEHQSELASTAAGLGDWGSKSRVLPPYPPYHTSSASGVVVLLPGRPHTSPRNDPASSHKQSTTCHVSCCTNTHIVYVRVYCSRLGRGCAGGKWMAKCAASALV